MLARATVNRRAISRKPPPESNPIGQTPLLGKTCLYASGYKAEKTDWIAKALKMNPYMSWSIVLVVAGGLGYYYTNGTKPKGRRASRTVVEKVESLVPAPKPKKQKDRKTADASSAPVRKPDEKSSVPDAPVYTADDEGDVSTQEFAKRLAAARTGVVVGESKPRAKETRTKTAPIRNVPESGGSEVSSHVSTGTVSNSGADADDDLSDVPVVVSADDISDMLEKPAPGASVLRLTGSLATEEKKKKAQSFKPVETKKQRQNRQKNEARKQANQEAEADRRQLLEKQLRTAREAERREAARKSPGAPATNAWTTPKTAPSTSNDAYTPTAQHTAPLLDTFEPEASQPASTHPASNGKWAHNLPPEEEQMRMLGVSQDGEDWTTVPSKKIKKKSTKAEDSALDMGAPDAPAAPEVEPVNEWVAPKVSKVPVPDSREKGHPLDSDWAA